MLSSFPFRTLIPWHPHQCSTPDVITDLGIDHSVAEELISLINARMSPQAKKVRSDIEVTCFSIHGVDGIRAAMVRISIDIECRRLQKLSERARCL